MKLNRQTAEQALKEASESNPGAWADHSRHVAKACENIASRCKGLSASQAYMFRLLHLHPASRRYRKQFSVRA